MKSIDIREALHAVAKKHGISLNVRKTSYDATSAEVELHVQIDTDDHKMLAQSVDGLRYVRECAHYGLDVSTLGKTIKTSYGAAVIVGWRRGDNTDIMAALRELQLYP